MMERFGIWWQMTPLGRVWIVLWVLALGAGVGLVVNDRRDALGWLLMFLGFMVTADVPLRIFRQKRMEKAWAATALALPMLDWFGKTGRIIGTDSEVVDTRHIPRPEFDGFERFEQLCRTRSGQWFKLGFYTGNGKPGDLCAVLLEEKEARSWLIGKQDIGLYSKYFGEPDVL